VSTDVDVHTETRNHSENTPRKPKKQSPAENQNNTK